MQAEQCKKLIASIERVVGESFESHVASREESLKRAMRQLTELAGGAPEGKSWKLAIGDGITSYAAFQDATKTNLALVNKANLIEAIMLVHKVLSLSV